MARVIGQKLASIVAENVCCEGMVRISRLRKDENGKESYHFGDSYTGPLKSDTMSDCGGRLRLTRWGQCSRSPYGLMYTTLHFHVFVSSKLNLTVELEGS